MAKTANNDLNSVDVNEPKYHPDPQGVNANATYYGPVALLDLVNKLMVMTPGSDPFDADMGIGIGDYEFKRFIELFPKLQERITKQATKYIDQSVEITLTRDENHSKTILVAVEVNGYINGVVSYAPNANGIIVFQSFLYH